MNRFILMEFSDKFENVTDEQIHKIAEQTNMINAVLITIIIITLVVGIFYLMWFHKDTKTARRVNGRYNGYGIANGTITKVEKVSYYVKPYERKNDKESVLEKYTAQEIVYKTNELKQELLEQPKELEKFRYQVEYTFNVEGKPENFSGEFFAYSEKDDIAVGKHIEVRYNPEKPQANFTEYSAPVGAQA